MSSKDLPRKVLVVDDECDLADLAAELLNAYGLGAFAAYSALEALQMLQHDNEIDAVFSDVMMPDMTGFQLANAVREKYPWVKIILTSGYTEPAMLKENEYAYLFVRKPYRIDVVLEALLHK